ncbi:dihydrofolate reductase family protein [Nonomuraea antimicrobica]
MRTFKLQVQTTIDGYMAGPKGEMDWVTSSWSDDLNTYVEALMESVDHIVLGRRLAEGFIPAWAAGPEGETKEGIAWMNDTPKVVISDSLAESPWPNATVAGETWSRPSTGSSPSPAAISSPTAAAPWCRA